MWSQKRFDVHANKFNVQCLNSNIQQVNREIELEIVIKIFRNLVEKRLYCKYGLGKKTFRKGEKITKF